MTNQQASFNLPYAQRGAENAAARYMRLKESGADKERLTAAAFELRTRVQLVKRLSDLAND